MSKLSFLKRRRVIAGTVIVGLVLVGAGLWFWHNGKEQPKVGKTSSGGYVNLSPATKAEKKETDSHKKALADGDDGASQQTSSASGKRQVTPIITSVDQSSVRGLVQGVIEDGGVCTVTLTKDSQTVTKTSAGVADASYTTCSTIELEGAVTSGSWKAVLSYSSPTAEGKSNAKSYNIQ